MEITKIKQMINELITNIAKKQNDKQKHHDKQKQHDKQDIQSSPINTNHKTFSTNIYENNTLHQTITNTKFNTIGRSSSLPSFVYKDIKTIQEKVNIMYIYSYIRRLVLF